MIALLAWLAGARADEHWVEAYPWAVTVGGTGRHLALYDVSGRPLSVRAALGYVSEPLVLRAYQEHRRNRLRVASALWAGGTAAFLVGWGAGDYPDPRPQQVLTVGGLALIAGGCTVLWIGPGRRLGDWVSRSQADRAVAAHARPPGSGGSEAGGRDRAALVLTLDADGRVRDGEGNPVPVDVLATRLGDEAIAEHHRAARRRARRTWLPMLWGGAAMVPLGAVTVALGAMMNGESFGDPDPTVPAVGAAIGLSGGALFGVGLGGWIRARGALENVGRWYEPADLTYEIHTYDRQLGQTLGARREEPAGLDLFLVVGPATVGLAGTF